MHSVVTVIGAVKPDLLAGWLADLSPAVEIRTDDDVTTVHGLDLDLHLDATTVPHVEPTWWVASVLRRKARTVADAGSCDSPGLENVLTDGSWTHPRARRGPADVAGVMLVKPGMRAGPGALREIGHRIAECGYRAERARVITAAEIERDDLAARHHGAHSALAVRGRMSPLERIAYLTIYDKPAFAERFGSTAAEVDVFPTGVVIEKLGVPVTTLMRWSMLETARHNLNSGAVDGPNGIGDYLFVSVFRDPDYHGGRPFAVLNPHMPGVLAEFSSGSGAVAVQISPVCDDALPWWRMRKEFCGVTDPREALPGSVRGDALAGLLDVSGEDGRPVRRINNGVHLSNGAVEALRDGWTWLRLAPDDTRAGQVLRAAGVPPWSVITKPFLVIGQTRRVAQELTDHLDAERAAAVLSSGTLIEHADEGDDWETVQLVDAVWSATSELRRDPASRAVVLVRPQDGATTTVLVITDEECAGRDVERPWDHQVPVVHCAAAEAPRALSQLAGDDGLSSDAVLPLWDPEDLVTRAVRGASAG
jgi:hypothetical protein